MTHSAAKRRLTNHLAKKHGITYKDADFAIASMTPKERVILSQEVKKSNLAKSRAGNP
jgi:hypothetical protein